MVYRWGTIRYAVWRNNVQTWSHLVMSLTCCKRWSIDTPFPGKIMCCWLSVTSLNVRAHKWRCKSVTLWSAKLPYTFISFPGHPCLTGGGTGCSLSSLRQMEACSCLQLAQKKCSRYRLRQVMGLKKQSGVEWCPCCRCSDLHTQTNPM